MKKPALLVLALAAVLAVSVALVGCGSSSSSSSSKNTIKVGCLYLGAANDGAFNQAMDDSIEKAKTTLQSEGITLEIMKNENTADDKQTVTDVATNMIDNGCTVIIGCSYGFGEGLQELANSGKYDNVTFLHFSGTYNNATNLENFFGSMCQARFLTGMAAAAASTTGQLGYVAAMDLPEVNIGINAFTLGAQYMAKQLGKDISVQVIYIGTWGDAGKERAASEMLITDGCDVLSYHADSTTTQTVAAENKVYAIGWNYDNPVAGDYYLTAAYWDFSGYFADSIRAISNGTFKPTNNAPFFSTYGSMASGMVNIASLNSVITGDAKQTIEDVQAKMKSGDFKVFSGVTNGEIKLADGTVLCTTTEALTDEEIWSKILVGSLVEGINAASSTK